MRCPPEIVLALPLVAAAVLLALLDRIPRRVTQWIAIVVAAATLTGTTTLLVQVTRDGAQLVWVGGWHPGNRVGIGIALQIDLAAALIAEFVSAIVAAAIVFSYEYFEDAGAIFYVLILAMLGGMIAFIYAADVFDIFVWYEVLSVAAYALAAYRSESRSAYKGALQFALTNSVAGLFFLVGIILLEGRTGELNLVAIGHSLASHGTADALLLTSLSFVSIGLYTRGALAPLHFWFDEVHAAAPAPLCALLSGAMAPLALYGFARIYWTTFSRTLPPSSTLEAATITIGALSACVGTVMTLRESRLKRKLAHATVAHSGVTLAAIGAFTPRALLAAGIYQASYAAAAAALFFALAILRSLTDEYDEKLLRGAGRKLPLTGVAFVLCTLSLAGVWTAGRAVIETGTGPIHVAIVILVVLVGAGTGGAFGAVFVHVFIRQPMHELPRRAGPVPWFLLSPTLVLAAVSVALGIFPHAFGAAVAHAATSAFRSFALTPMSVEGWLAPAGAALVAYLVVSPAAVWRRFRIALARSAAVRSLIAVDNGDAGGYIAWIAGTAALLTAVLTFG